MGIEIFGIHFAKKSAKDDVLSKAVKVFLS